MFLSKNAKRFMSTAAVLAMTVASLVVAPKVEAAGERTVGPETISDAKVSVNETGTGIRYMVSATLAKGYSDDLGIKLTAGNNTPKIISLKKGAPKLYSRKDNGDGSVTVQYAVAVTNIPEGAKDTVIKAQGFAKDTKATEVSRTVTEAAKIAGYTFGENGKLTYSPFASVDVKGAKQYEELKVVQYTVGARCPTSFDVDYETTPGTSINIEMFVGKDYQNCYGCGGSGTKSLDLTQKGWSPKDAIGTDLAEGTVITIKAVAASALDIKNFKINSIIPKGNGVTETNIITNENGGSPYVWEGAAQYYSIIDKVIDSSLSGKKLSNYRKVIIECEDETDFPLNYGVAINKVSWCATNIFFKGSATAGTIEIPLDETGFMAPAQQYPANSIQTIGEALDLDAGSVKLLVSTPVAGYKGKITVKSVRFE